MKAPTRRPGVAARKTDGDVLALISVIPRDVFEVAEALSISSPLARAALDSLVQQGLAEEAHRYPTEWRAL